MKPYSSLYENYKEIIYKEDFSFLHIIPENVHPNLLKRDLFSKHLIMMNRYYTKIDMFHLRPKHMANWEEYQDKLSEFEDMKYYIRSNVSFYRKLKLIQINVQNYIIEIYREIATRKLLFYDRDNEFTKITGDILKLLHNYLIEGNIKSETLNGFLLYVIQLSKLYYNKEKNSISDIITEKFGKIDSKLKMGGFPKQTFFITRFLYYTTSSLNSIYDWAQKALHKDLNNPKLDVELFSLELFQIKENELPKLETNLRKHLSELKTSKFTEVDQISKDWNYELYLQEYSGIDELELKINKYIGIAKENELKNYEMLIKKSASEIRKKIVCLLYTSPSPRDRS